MADEKTNDESSNFTEFVDGVPIPVFPVSVSMEEQMKKLKEMQIRDDDVFLCAYSKSGTHWIWEMTSMLLKGSSDYDLRSKEVLMLEALPVESFDEQPSPRILNSHLYFRFLPRQVLQKRSKIIYVSRNPKDIMVSYFYHVKVTIEPYQFKGDFMDFFQKYIYGEKFDYGPWFDYVLDWEKAVDTSPDLQILVLTYEDTKQDPMATVKKLAKFLGIQADDKLCSEIVSACSFQKLKKASADLKTDPFQDWLIEGTDLYRKGEVGDWKNWFTVAMNEDFDRIYAEKMKDSKLSVKYTI